jgi:tetratricopeptide (TPR) repeat protein
MLVTAGERNPPMTSSLFRRILFVAAAALSTTACGDQPTRTPEPAPQPTPHQVVPQRVPDKVVTTTPIVVEEMPAEYAVAMKLGKEAVVAGDVARARAMFDTASRLDGKQHEPHLELARLLLTTGDEKLALVEAKKAVKLAPKSSAAWNTLGRAHRARFQYDAAITAFEAALDRNPKNGYAWNNLGLTLLDLELWLEAKNALEEATALPEATGYMWNNLGIAYEHLDLLDDARVAFEKGADHGSAAAKASRERLEGVKTIASANVIVTDVELVSDAEQVVEEAGQIDEAAIVEEALAEEAKAAAEAAARDEVEEEVADPEAELEHEEETAVEVESVSGDAAVTDEVQID